MTTSDVTVDRMELYLENGVIYLGVNVGSGEKVRVLAVVVLHCYLDHLHPYKDLAAVKR